MTLILGKLTGERLYEFGGTLYQKIYDRGVRAYQVVGYLD